jgi:hypothetical protein
MHTNLTLREYRELLSPLTAAGAGIRHTCRFGEHIQCGLDDLRLMAEVVREKHAALPQGGSHDARRGSGHVRSRPAVSWNLVSKGLLALR